MVQLTALIRSRIELERRPEPSDSFEIVPHDFAIGTWADFDTNSKAEINAFSEFCQLALGHNFTAIYWMPKYIVQLDPSGQQVAAHVERYIADSPDIDGDALARLGYLASAYPDDSDAWAAVSRPICAKADTMPRKVREQVYFGLARKETGALTSMPGEVPHYYEATRDKAIQLRDAEPAGSPLCGYREWALTRAEADLRRAQERAEEDANG